MTPEQMMRAAAVAAAAQVFEGKGSGNSYSVKDLARDLYGYIRNGN